MREREGKESREIYASGLIDGRHADRQNDTPDHSNMTYLRCEGLTDRSTLNLCLLTPTTTADTCMPTYDSEKCGVSGV